MNKAHIARANALAPSAPILLLETSKMDIAPLSFRTSANLVMPSIQPHDDFLLLQVNLLFATFKSVIDDWFSTLARATIPSEKRLLLLMSNLDNAPLALVVLWMSKISRCQN